MHELDSDDEGWGNTPPGYPVFPALVVGVGQHGESVVRRLHRRLRDEDPNLLSLVRLCILLGAGGGTQLVEMDALSGHPISTRYPAGAALADLLGPTGTLTADLQQICDTLAIHEQMQLLHERGYEAYEEDHDIRIRVYLVTDLNEEVAREAFRPLAAAVQELLRRRGDLRCTAICLERDEATHLPAGTVDALYLTNHVKHHGFLAANQAEIEVAHSLFLESMLLSTLETTVRDGEDQPGAATFGISAVRLGIDEMASWLRSQIARIVIQESYLGSGDDTGADAQENVQFWRTQWDAMLHGITTPAMTIDIHEDVPVVTLPTDSALRIWCGTIVRQRLLAPRSDLVDVLDHDLAAIPCPLPDLLVTCNVQLHRGADTVRRAMHERLGTTCFTGASGAMTRASHTLDAWTRVMQRTADRATREKPVGLISSEESEFLIWLHESLDDIALRVRRRRQTQATSTALLSRVTVLAVLVGAILRSLHGSAPVTTAVVAAIVLLVGVAGAILNEHRRRDFEQRVFAQFIDRLERRLGQWLHTRAQENLADMIRWTSDAGVTTEVLRAEFERLHTRYCALSSHVPVAADTCFLEQVHVDSEHCKELLQEVDEGQLLEEDNIVQLPLRFLLPLGEATQETGPTIVDDAELEHLLLEAIDSFAHPQLRSLHLHSLHDLIIESAQDAQTIEERCGATLQALHERALPLRQFAHTVSADAEEQRLVAGARHLRAVSSAPLEGPMEITACLVPFGSDEWKRAVEIRSSGPSHVHAVKHADRETLLYVRTVFGLPAAEGG